MSETIKTTSWVAAALLALAVTVSSIPTRATPGAFTDLGEPFFPEFEDPNRATTLEVIEFDEDTGVVRPFRVTFTDGLWSIPSHHGYPADAEDRLARTAAGVIGITKDQIRSDNAADHELLSVIDPLDESATTLSGRGQRVTLRSENDRVLADFIVGAEVEGRPGFRFVRIPDQNRVYAARMDVDLSTRFEDWIETDLLSLNASDIDGLLLADYSVNEQTLTIDERDIVTLTKAENLWEGDDAMPEDREVDTAAVNSLLNDLSALTIVGVRPKPEGVSPQLERTAGGLAIAPQDLLSLQSRGYYFTQDGRLRSNEGELQVNTTDHLLYTLRFGEVLYGTGEAVSAGSDASDDAEAGPGENRYLFITVDLDRAALPEPPAPENTEFLERAEDEWTDEDRANQALQNAHDEWTAQVAEGEERVAELQRRFGSWYYVISSESFDNVRKTRVDLTRERPEPPAPVVDVPGATAPDLPPGIPGVPPPPGL